jgi:hypothetical protein
MKPEILSFEVVKMPGDLAFDCEKFADRTVSGPIAISRENRQK